MREMSDNDIDEGGSVSGGEYDDEEIGKRKSSFDNRRY